MFNSTRPKYKFKREHFPFPTVEKNLGKMSEATIFSRLDAKKGFIKFLWGQVQDEVNECHT